MLNFVITIFYGFGLTDMIGGLIADTTYRKEFVCRESVNCFPDIGYSTS